MEDSFVVAFFFLLLGVPGAVFPYRVTRFFERLDAVGSTTPWDEVEPADWNVALTRFVGVFFAALGVAYLFA